MNCTDFHEIISAYVDDELSERDTKRLLDHLENCRDCNGELSHLTLQRERLRSLRDSYGTQDPDSGFSRTVMAAIDQVSLPRISPVRRFFEGIVEELLLPIRKPAVALPLLLLLVTGTVTGFYLRSLPNNQRPQMLSVYELAAAQPVPGQVNDATPVAEKVEGHLCDHFADTSTETFAAQPCLLEYASYTCGSQVEDY